MQQKLMDLLRKHKCLCVKDFKRLLGEDKHSIYSHLKKLEKRDEIKTEYRQIQIGEVVYSIKYYKLDLDI